MHSINDLRDGFYNSFDVDRMYRDLHTQLLKKYGGLVQPPPQYAHSFEPVLGHFLACDDALALEFIEQMFQVFVNPGQRGVDVINAIFEEEGIGYQLTPYIETITEEPGSYMGRPMGKLMHIQRPRIIKRGDEFVQTEIVQPAIELLKDSKFKGANEEFVKAHEHYRSKDYKACLVDCGKSFESTMKVICHHKKWQFDEHRDTASKLIKICVDNGLLPTHSEQQLTALRMLLESGVPTIRNRQGGHGQGVQQNDVSPEMARYAMHLTAANVILLVESAKL
ncbi:MAG: hypothetical protein J0M17_03535 [Planctomycetes bacterium]|nr:hypothetical protein [Planctomycetota bacterium]